MGQILIVQGQQPAIVAARFERAIQLFEDIAHLRPEYRSDYGQSCVATFPQLHGRAHPISEDGETRTWASAVGTFCYARQTGDDAVRHFGRDVARMDPASVMSDADGSFGAVWGPSDGSEVYVATDRIGTIHLYAASTADCTVISTSSLIIAALLRPEWNPVACCEFVATGNVFSHGATLFRGIEKLDGASIYPVRQGRVGEAKKYWLAAEVMYDRRQTPAGLDELLGSLEDTLQTIRKNFRRPLLDLTGGFDSRALVAVMLKSGLSFDTIVNGRPTDSDVMIAARIAGRFGLSHRHSQPDVADAGRWWNRAKQALPLCDGEYDVLLYARVLDVHSRMAADFDSSINGSYGELSRGLFWELAYPRIGSTRPFNKQRLAEKRYLDGSAVRFLDWEPAGNLSQHFVKIIDDANRGFEKRPNTVQLDINTLLVYAQRWQGRIASCSNRIWPVMAPFLWRRPLEAALGAPPHLRVRNRLIRRLIETCNPALADIPLSHGYPAVPLRLRNVHKFHAVPGLVVRKLASKYLNGHHSDSSTGTQEHNPVLGLWYQDEVADILEPSSMKTRDLYRIPELKSFLSASRSGNFNEAKQFGRVLTLEMLARRL